MAFDWVQKNGAIGNNPLNLLGVVTEGRETRSSVIRFFNSLERPLPNLFTVDTDAYSTGVSGAVHKTYIRFINAVFSHMGRTVLLG